MQDSKKTDLVDIVQTLTYQTVDNGSRAMTCIAKTSLGLVHTSHFCRVEYN